MNEILKKNDPSNIIIVFLLFLTTTICLIGCSSGVIKRSERGDHLGHNQVNPNTLNPIKKKMALLGFFNDSPYGGMDLARSVTEELRNELSRSGQFLIDPLGDKLFGSSKEIYAGGGSKLVQLARKAKVAGLNFVLFGRIVDAKVRERTDEIGMVRETKSFAESVLEIRIFDVNSNREIYSDTLRGFTEDTSLRFYSSKPKEKLSYRQQLLRYAVAVAVRRSIPHIVEISSKMDWVGRVAKILGNKIYINAGRESGLNIGDILKVITEGTEIYDPETGALIGVSKGEIKGTIEVIDYFGPDGAVATLHTGGSVMENDFVQLY